MIRMFLKRLIRTRTFDLFAVIFFLYHVSGFNAAFRAPAKAWCLHEKLRNVKTLPVAEAFVIFLVFRVSGVDPFHYL